MKIKYQLYILYSRQCNNLIRFLKLLLYQGFRLRSPSMTASHLSPPSKRKTYYLLLQARFMIICQPFFRSPFALCLFNFALFRKLVKNKSDRLSVVAWKDKGVESHQDESFFHLIDGQCHRLKFHAIVREVKG